MQDWIGTVAIFGGTFIPAGWLPCDGRMLTVSEDNEDLFNIIGNVYGGDGESTFQLPDLRNCVAVGANAATFTMGSSGGSDTVTLSIGEIPDHKHTGYIVAAPVQATTDNPVNNFLGTSAGVILHSADTIESHIYGDPGTGTQMFQGSIGVAYSGEGAAHSNMMPGLGMIYCICVSGNIPTFS